MSLEKYGLSENFDSSKIQEFGTEFLTHFFEGGWGSLPKKDFESLIYILLEKNGAITSGETNFTIARKLRITESKAASLRRDSYARWHTLAPLKRDETIQRILSKNINEEEILRLFAYVNDSKRKEGFVPILLDNPVYREEFIHAMKEIDAIPVYERNREVVLIKLGDLHELARKHELVKERLEEVWPIVQKLCKKESSLEEICTYDVDEVKEIGIRKVLNKLGAKLAISGTEQLFCQVTLELIRQSIFS